MIIYKLLTLLFITFALCGCRNSSFSRQILVLSSTTSVVDSGLLDEIIPLFEKKNNCKVKVIAVGSGQAIRLAQDGNADIVFSHDEEAEKKFVKDNYGIKRIPVMHNEFFLVGPKSDPAKIKGEKSVVNAFLKIAKTKSKFISRSDNSGTHKKELQIWELVNLQFPISRLKAQSWYIESGAGMETTLRIAQEKNAYCLVDRATYLSHKKENNLLQILVKNDPILFNPYSVIVVSPYKLPNVNYKLAQKFADFITGPEGQKIIKNFGIDRFGEPLYFPSVIK